MTVSAVYLNSAIQRLRSYKELGEGTFAQLEFRDLVSQANDTCNSIAQIVCHMSGNMLSRWTNFLTEDGEKTWRNRDLEFEKQPADLHELMDWWDKGWKCLMGALENLTENDLQRTIYIRHEPLVVVDAINRQLAHYAYHVGQIVYIGKMIRKDNWHSLSIPKGRSESFNQEMRGKAGK
jgi:hypothetical protein